MLEYYTYYHYAWLNFYDDSVFPSISMTHIWMTHDWAIPFTLRTCAHHTNPNHLTIYTSSDFNCTCLLVYVIQDCTSSSSWVLVSIMQLHSYLLYETLLIPTNGFLYPSYPQLHLLHKILQMGSWIHHSHYDSCRTLTTRSYKSYSNRILFLPQSPLVHLLSLLFNNLICQ